MGGGGCISIPVARLEFQLTISKLERSRPLRGLDSLVVSVYRGSLRSPRALGCRPLRRLVNPAIQTLTLFLITGAAAVTATAQQFAATAPLTWRGLMPVVEVKLNGQGPFALAIDTGSGMQADIDPSVATQLQLTPKGRVRSGDPSQVNDRDLETSIIDSVSLGGVEFRQVTTVIRKQRITADYPDVDGILGFPLFTEYLLTLDYPAMQVRLVRGSLPAANDADILPFEIENRIPVIQLAIGRMKVKAHLDTGNFVAGFILPEDLIEHIPLASPPVTVGRARSISNQIEIKQAQLNDTIRIGRFDFPQAVVSFPALSNTNIGFKVLRDFTLTFDQKGRRVKFNRANSPATETVKSGANETEEYAGTYGVRSVTLEADGLYLERQGGPKLKLVPRTRDEFTLNEAPNARIIFVRDKAGKITTLRVLNRDGEWETAVRGR